MTLKRLGNTGLSHNRCRYPQRRLCVLDLSRPFQAIVFF